MFLGRPEDLHDTSQLFLFVLSREYRHTSVQFSKNATQTPHVDWEPIGHSQDHLGRTVEAGLNVGIHLLVFEATRSEIDNLYLRMHRMAKQDVLRFEIAVDDFLLLQQIERAQHLLGEPPDELDRETSEGVRLDEFVEVHIEKLSRDAQMATEVEMLGHLDDVVLLVRILPKVSAPSILCERLQEHDVPISGDYPRS